MEFFENTATSRYDALQLELRGRLRSRLLYRAGYTFSKATDDVSDVFELAGAPALPQNSLTFAGERGPANFDARHRFASHAVYDFPRSTREPRASSSTACRSPASGSSRRASPSPSTPSST